MNKSILCLIAFIALVLIGCGDSKVEHTGNQPDGKDNSSGQDNTTQGSNSYSREETPNLDNTNTGVQYNASADKLIKGKLTITVDRVDNSGRIFIFTIDGKDHILNIKKANKLTVKSGCHTDIKVRAINDGDEYAGNNPLCFVGHKVTKSKVMLGFDSECDETNWEDIDDEIVTLSCSKDKVGFKGVRLDSSINVNDWLN